MAVAPHKADNRRNAAPEAATAGRTSPGDSMGNRDPRPGRSPGYDEQQPPDATAAQKPGGKRAPDAEAGGVERNVESEPGAETT